MINELTIHTDGGARGNPGPAAVGVVIKKDGKLVYGFGRKIGEATNNVAEYAAVVEAFKYLKKNKDIGRKLTVHFYLDSLLVVNQLIGKFKVKDAKLRLLLLEVRSLEQDLSAGRRGSGSIFTYTAISREQNHHADLLVNQALDEYGS